ncbi:MAG: hypothetical protein HDT19_05360 [Oscillibacter sp.]|nr:hypothetical protein [Oscillibacter sp.]MBD5148191.1 hypothetical protein [Oscillibacter sp.]
MSQLIEIKSVPIEIEMKMSHARLEYTRASADLEISRDKGGLSIKSRPIRLNVDTFEMRNSILPTPVRSIEQAAQKGKQAAYEATATYAQQGELLLKAKIGEDVMAQYEARALSPHMDSQPGLTFIPTTGPEIDWDPGELNIRFEMDKLNFDWRLNQTQLEFIPGDIEITVKQQPDVIIKYIGGPLYVPPSSDPNYEPVDVQA